MPSLLNMGKRVVDKLRDKHFERWATGYLRHLAAPRNAPKVQGTRHLLFAFAITTSPSGIGPRPRWRSAA